MEFNSGFVANFITFYFENHQRQLYSFDMDHQLPVFPTFNYEVSKANASAYWNRWINRLENLFVAMDLEDDDDKRKRASEYQKVIC